MTYAVVQDVPASWEQYEELGDALRERVPEGLIFHVAGPTDEGYRTIEVWETREAWERFRGGAGPGRPRPTWAIPALRGLQARIAIAGAPLPGTGLPSPQEAGGARDGFAAPASATNT